MKVHSVVVAVIVAIISVAALAAFFWRAKQVQPPNLTNHESVDKKSAAPSGTTAPKKSVPSDQLGDAPKPQIQAKSTPSNSSNLELRMQAVNQLQDPPLSREEIETALTSPHYFEPLQEPPKTIPLPDKALNDDREFIRINRHKVASLLPGDIMEFSYSGLSETYQIEILDRVKNTNNSVTWHGRIVNGGDGNHYKVSITQSAQLTLMGVNTPEGHIALQTNDSEGWIASSGTLFVQDPNTPDYVIPDDAKGLLQKHQH